MTGLRETEAPFGSDLYRQCLALREAILRKPLGLSLNEEERADDRIRQHFCAIDGGVVIACLSLKPLDGETLQLKQMAVAELRRSSRHGARLLAYAEGWAEKAGYRRIVMHARIGAEGFYAKFGYTAEGEPFDENTIPHIQMTKMLMGAATPERSPSRS